MSGMSAALSQRPLPTRLLYIGRRKGVRLFALRPGAAATSLEQDMTANNYVSVATACGTSWSALAYEGSVTP